MLAPARSPWRTIIPVRFGLVLGCFALLLLPGAVGTASAQVTTTTINQTSCIQGDTNPTGPCLTGGFLKDLTVDCSLAGAAGKISTALSNIQDRSGPNRITVTGTCGAEVVTVSGFNRLTIQGGVGGATISNKALTITNSTVIILNALTFTATQVTGAMLNVQASSVFLNGVTVQNSSGTGINVFPQSTLGFTSTPSVISGNGFAGIAVGAGSTVGVGNVTISNNGSLGGGFDLLRAGIAATNGASVVLDNRSAGGANGPVDIFQNAGNGILLTGGSRLSSEAIFNPSLIHIHDNGKTNLAVEGGDATIIGNFRFDGAPGASSFGPVQIGVFSGRLEIGGGVVVQGGVGGAVNSNLIIGSEGPMTVTGGVTLLFGSTGFLIDSNSIDTLTCDATSWAANGDDQSTIGNNTCPSTGPTVTVNAGTGLSGGGTIGQGGSVTLTNMGVLSVSADSPLTSTGGQNAVVGLTPNYFIQNGTSPQSNASFNVAGNGTIGGSSTIGGNGSVGGTLSAASNNFGVDANGAVTIGNGTPITRYASATFTINVPSLKPNTCTNSTQAFAAVGSGTNDTLALGVPNAFMSVGGFVIFQAWESAPNTITIRACNVSPNGPATSAVSGALRVSLFKH
jgi:hypothetical protein